METYQTITGRKFELSRLTAAERAFLVAVLEKYRTAPDWTAFAAWWTAEMGRAGLGEASPVYRICQDLEARLGIAQGKVAMPDYRDFLADLIEERFDSRNRFCEATGVDPGHLSRVLAGRSELSLQALQKMLQALGAALVIQTQETLAAYASPEQASRLLAAAAR